MAGSVDRGVALGGFMGVGKTSVGVRLARRLGLPFVDMDAELVARFGPIADQFRRDGEAAFRVRESAMVGELCDGTSRVIATGGGAWVSPGNRARLNHYYWTVVLSAPLSVLRERLGPGVGRPLWGDAERLLYERAEAYADAHLVVDTSGVAVEAVVDEIVEWLEARPGVAG